MDVTIPESAPITGNLTGPDSVSEGAISTWLWELTRTGSCSLCPEAAPSAFLRRGAGATLPVSNLRYRLRSMERLRYNERPFVTLILTYSDQATRPPFSGSCSSPRHRASSPIDCSHVAKDVAVQPPNSPNSLLGNHGPKTPEPAIKGCFISHTPAPPLPRWERIEVRVILLTPLNPAFSRKRRRSLLDTLQESVGFQVALLEAGPSP